MGDAITHSNLMFCINEHHYRNLRIKGYTHTLIEHLTQYNPNRLLEMYRDPWAFPVLGDPSAPVECNSPFNQQQEVMHPGIFDECEILEVCREPGEQEDREQWVCRSCGGPFEYPVGQKPNFCPYCRATILDKKE